METGKLDVVRTAAGRYLVTDKHQRQGARLEELLSQAWTLELRLPVLCGTGLVAFCRDSPRALTWLFPSSASTTCCCLAAPGGPEVLPSALQ